MFLPLLFIVSLQLNPPTPDISYKQPQLAAGADGLTVLAFGAQNRVLVGISKDGGRTFGSPVEVAQVDGLMLGRHRGPRVAISQGTILVSAISSKSGDLTVWRSADRGHTWSPGVLVNDVPHSAAEGLHAFAADLNGNVFAAWLDTRVVKGKRLYGSHSSDAGVTWSKSALVYASPDGTICECCHPSAVFDSGGKLWVMWRNFLNGSRDLYVARSETLGATFSKAEKLGQGTWTLNACPMDGGGIAAAGNGIVTAWRRGSELFLAKPGEPEHKLGDGKDVALASTAKGVYAVWSERGGLQALTPAAPVPVRLAETGSYPSLVALPDGRVLAAWENDGRIAIAALP